MYCILKQHIHHTLLASGTSSNTVSIPISYTAALPHACMFRSITCMSSHDLSNIKLLLKTGMVPVLVLEGAAHTKSAGLKALIALASSHWMDVMQAAFASFYSILFLFCCAVSLKACQC